jgi:hypothetical protein
MEVIGLLGRLRTHQAEIVATFGQQEGIVGRIPSVEHPQRISSWIDFDNVTTAKMGEVGLQVKRVVGDRAGRPGQEQIACVAQRKLVARAAYKQVFAGLRRHRIGWTFHDSANTSLGLGELPQLKECVGV